MHTVIFDLDGTLSDSADGIVKSINHALKNLGYDEMAKEELLHYIGPPLEKIFENLTDKKNDEFILKAVRIFRERYFSVGFMENVLYEGIGDVLEHLSNEGNTICIATTKRTDIAKNVLSYFNIDKYFTQVQGSDIYPNKADLLKNMAKDTAFNKNPMIMIGDRESDFKAASEAGMPSLAVKWGYGSEDELKLATAVVEKTSDLPYAILENARRVL